MHTGSCTVHHWTLMQHLPASHVRAETIVYTIEEYIRLKVSFCLLLLTILYCCHTSAIIFLKQNSNVTKLRFVNFVPLKLRSTVPHLPPSSTGYNMLTVEFEVIMLMNEPYVG